MNAFLDNARGLFEVAGSDNGGNDCDFALFVRRDGGLHMVMDLGSVPGGVAPGLDLPVPAEVGEGFTGSYRVTRLRGAVRVQGRSGAHRCLLESPAAGEIRRMVLRDDRLYSVVSSLPAAPAGDNSLARLESGGLKPAGLDWPTRDEDRATTIPHTM